MGLDSIRNLLTQEFPSTEFLPLENSTPAGFLVPPEMIHAVCSFLHSNENTYFDHLACLTAIDNGVEKHSMEVIYTLYSIPKNLHLTLKVILDRTKPIVDSISDIWGGANWHEREAFDLFGIQFTNHPDLRRILLPADWVGHPMRKDYKEDETYHGMTIVHPDKLANE